MKTHFEAACPTLAAILFTALVAVTGAAAQPAAEPPRPPSPLAHFEPFIGGWAPAPDSAFVQERPELADDIAFLFAWAGEEKKILRFYEGVEDGDLERRMLECMAAADPRSGEIVFVGYQVRGDFLYRGTFEPIENGFRRHYEVTYPPGTELPEENRERGAIDYRDTCRLVAPDRLHCTTEQRRGGAWKAWGSAEGYTLVRADGAGRPAASPPKAGGRIEPLPPPPEMEHLGFLVGTWHSSAELLDREGKGVGTFDSAELPGGGGR